MKIDMGKINISTKVLARKLFGNEKGLILPLVLIFMALGVIIMVPLLQYMGAGLKIGQKYQGFTDELYAADAGIQDGIWQIKFANINSYTSPVAYSPYDFTHSWSIPDSRQLNGLTPSVTIANTWIPSNITTPTSTQAANLIQAGKLIITDQVAGASTCNINVNYYKAGSDPNLKISSLGVWIPAGYTYVANSSNLWNTAHTQRLYSSETISYYGSGQAVLWSFSPAYPFAGDASHDPFPGVNSSDTPMASAVSFQFASQQTTGGPSALSWITTTGVSDIPFSWDADVKVYHIASTAGSTTVDSFLTQQSLRQLSRAINGDYRSIGNSLMIMGSGHTQDNDPKGIRYQNLTSSSATVNTIPSDATVTAAYLYWSGWLNSSTKTLGSSYGTLVNFTINGHQVNFNGSGSPNRGNQAIASTRNQTCQTYATGNGDFAYSCYRDVTQLVQWELRQEDPNATSYPGNGTYIVGPGAGCTLGDTGNEKSFCGWSLILIYTSPSTQGHQMYLYDTFTYAPPKGATGYPTNGSDIDPTGATAGPGGVISGFLVPQPVAGETDAATLTAFVAEGDWSYAGDFIAVNAPSQYWSNPWSIPDGSSCKLWDGITQDTSHLAGAPSLPNTAAQPDNVWNGYSQTGLNDGVDMKTFHITWASNLIQPGDTSARIDMPTQLDSWDLVYLILSFRSTTTTGNQVSYNISR
jgi:hypothetical protein